MTIRRCFDIPEPMTQSISVTIDGEYGETVSVKRDGDDVRLTINHPNSVEGLSLINIGLSATNAEALAQYLEACVVDIEQ